MSHREAVPGHPGIYVRRLSFRAFHAVQQTAAAGEKAGDPRDVAFACALALACAESEDGTPYWSDYEAVATDERPMLVTDVAAHASVANGLVEADEGNA